MKYINALNKIPGIGSVRLQKAIDYFGTAEQAWNADQESLVRSGLGSKVAGDMVNLRNKINPEREWDMLEKLGIRMVTAIDAEYPKLLLEYPGRPYVLYVRGSASLDSIQPALSVVGSRKLSGYGKQVAYQLSKDMAQAGITIISGLALGIDAVAHRGALDGGGKTLAVLGNSLDDPSLSPRSNFRLAQEIIKNGALVSEYPPVTTASPQNFPARNRIMAGFSLGTLVVEAAIESGSLITARYALDANREVFAIPGSIFSPASKGAHGLIKSGAKLVEGVSDILEELGIDHLSSTVSKTEPPKLDATEEKIIRAISCEAIHIDAIRKMTGLETGMISSTLTLLEMKGMVKNIGGQNYIKISNS